jgi:hypothetical protein
VRLTHDRAQPAAAVLSSAAGRGRSQSPCPSPPPFASGSWWLLARLLTIADWCLLRIRCIADAHVTPLSWVRAGHLRPDTSSPGYGQSGRRRNSSADNAGLGNHLLGCVHGQRQQDAIVSTPSYAAAGKFGQACPNFSPSAHHWVRAQSMSGPDYSCKPERVLTKDEVRAELARIRPGAADALNDAVAGHAARAARNPASCSTRPCTVP